MAASVRAGRSAASGPHETSRRDEILQIAASTFADLGYSRATIRDIGKRAGILNGSLYYHFDSKESMVEELLRPFLAELLQRCKVAAASTDNAEAALERLIRENVVLISERIEIVQLLQKDWRYLSSTFPYVESGLAKTERVWLKVLNQGREQGVFRDELDARIVYKSIRSAVFDVSYWDSRTHRIRIDKVADMLVTLFMGGLKV